MRKASQLCYLLVLVAMVAGTSATRAVVNGVQTDDYKFVGQVFMNRSVDMYVGNGVLINPTMALSSAEIAAILPAGQGTIYFEGQPYTIVEVIIHPLYNPNTLDYNVAMLVLQYPVMSIVPSRLMQRAPIVGESLTLVGNGSLYPQGAVDDATAKVRRQGTIILDEVAATEVAWTVDSTAAVTIAPGDAAAATFYEEDGDFYLVSVATRHTRDDYGVGDNVYSARVDSMLDFLSDPMPGPQTVVYRFNERITFAGQNTRRLVTRNGFIAMDRFSGEMWSIHISLEDGQRYVRVEPWHAQSVPGSIAPAVAPPATHAFETVGGSFVHSLYLQQQITPVGIQLRELAGISGTMIYNYPFALTATGSTFITDSSDSFGIDNTVGIGNSSIRLDPVRTKRAMYTTPLNVIDDPDSDLDIAGEIFRAYPNAIDQTIPENGNGSTEVALAEALAARSDRVTPTDTAFPLYVYLVRAWDVTVGNGSFKRSNGIGALIVDPNAIDGDQAQLLVGFQGDRAGLRRLFLKSNNILATNGADEYTFFDYYDRYRVNDAGNGYLNVLVSTLSGKEYEKVLLVGSSPIDDFPLVWNGRWTSAEPGQVSMIGLTATFSKQYTLLANGNFEAAVADVEQALRAALGQEQFD